MLKLLKKIDHKLLPRPMDFQYGPYVWLIYLFIFFLSLAQYHPIENSYLYATIGTVLFLAVYFNGYWATARKVKWNIFAILVIGSLMALLSSGASVFFVYAAAFCYSLGSTKKAFIGIILIVAWIMLFSWINNLDPYFYLPGIIFTFLIGGLNIYQHDISLKRKELILSQKEVRHLAKISERERIARDLHDLIGHTFSVITLKAELANKLINKDLSKAKDEISALENISRDALSQIREVVTGYRTSDLNTELTHAKYVLESNDISFYYQFDEFDISEHINKELAIILKELITNILKHSEADRVDLVVKHQDNCANLQVKDNGVGFSEQKHQGFGLKGISERVSKLHGKLLIKSFSGTLIDIKIPLAESK